MIDVLATAAASKLLEALAKDRGIPEEARLLLLRAMNWLDDQLRCRLSGRTCRCSATH